MLSRFGHLVSELYADWEDCLMESLELSERTYFQSIRNNTATEGDLELSLYKLSCFLAQKFCRKVIVLIDEYEVPIYRAYDHGYIDEVRSLYLFL